jgi:hypothetical protein
VCNGGCVSGRTKAFAAGKPLYKELSLLPGAGSFGAAIASRELFDAPSRVDEFLFASEKGMTSGANADLNIATRGAGVIYRAARAHHISLVVFRMNACFHLLMERGMYAQTPIFASNESA